MCQADSTSPHIPPAPSDDFPWEAGVHDAHCHPTDTMSSVSDIAGMRAEAVTAMATRSQDQDLVATIALKQGMPASTTEGQTWTRGKIIPSFGWHPWFSYQLYDDTVPVHERTYNPDKAVGDEAAAEKLRHFAAVLKPSLEDADLAARMPPLKSLSEFIAETRQRLTEFPTALVGEIGLDKRFRIPEPPTDGESARQDDGQTPGGRDGRRLSKYLVSMPHQLAIFKAQLKLAGEMNRPVSIHGVQAPGNLHEALAECWKGHEVEVLSRRERKQIAKGAEQFETFSSSDEEEGQDQPKPYPPRICLHSYSGTVETLRQYLDPAIPAKIFFSFSICINFSESGGSKALEAMTDVVAACPEDRILVESDLNAAGDGMDAALEGICRKVCQIRGWELKHGVETIGRNYREYITGGRSWKKTEV